MTPGRRGGGAKGGRKVGLKEGKEGEVKLTKFSKLLGFFWFKSTCFDVRIKETRSNS